MRYYLQAKSQQMNSTVWVHTISGASQPESLTFRQARAFEFSTDAGDDIAQTCRAARKRFDLDFRVTPLCPPMSPEEFNRYRCELDNATIEAYYGKLIEQFGAANSLVVFALAVKDAESSVPAFMNADVLQDYSMKLGQALVRHIHAARTGSHHLGQNKAS